MTDSPNPLIFLNGQDIQNLTLNFFLTNACSNKDIHVNTKKEKQKKNTGN